MRGISLEVLEITKSYGKQKVLDKVNLKVERKEFFTILGPSGCGKTTLLHIIAGLVTPDSGKILFDGKDVTNEPPHKRDIGMVFQDLALFPHMTVAENIAFGLKLRNKSEQEIKARVKEMLELVRLNPSEVWNKYPAQLSGGQQQRVALARALAVEPRLLLLDEPLSHVDYKIKQELLAELRRIHKETGVTTLYVTHDQNEAMYLSDRIAVMNYGRIEQIGTPEELYNNPASLFVASFFGDANIMPLKLIGNEENKILFARLDNTVIFKEQPIKDGYLAYLKGVISDKVFMGPQVLLEIRIDEKHTVKTILPRNEATKYNIGDEVIVAFTSEAKIIEAQ
jgi:ABC-type Fe3+/spermidine/putrescine transport system ATPase subunit